MAFHQQQQSFRQLYRMHHPMLKMPQRQQSHQFDRAYRETNYKVEFECKAEESYK